MNIPLRRGGLFNPFKVGKEALQRAIDFTFADNQTRIPSQVRTFLKDHGNNIIVKIRIYREPIHKVIDKVLNVISLGYWQDVKDKLDYDNLFHLWIEVDLNNGSSWSMEKNEVVQVKPVRNMKSGLYVPINRPITVNQFFEGGKKILGNRFWIYNAKSANCQVWVASMLLGSHLLTNEAKEFVIQDTETVISQLPAFTEKIINGTTDIASRFDILRHGYGIKKGGKVNNFIYYNGKNNKISY